MIKDILNITGKSGLYRLISRSTKMLVVETLDETKKRIPVYPSDQVVSLGDISMYMNDGTDIPFAEVLENIKAKLEGQEETSIDPRKASTDQLKAWFETMQPNFDQDRVKGGDIKKVILWYNILIRNGITEFSDKEKDAE